MDEKLYVILKVLLDFALKVWFSIFKAITGMLVVGLLSTSIARFSVHFHICLMLNITLYKWNWRLLYMYLLMLTAHLFIIAFIFSVQMKAVLSVMVI